MARSNRISVTVSPSMTVALELLAERSGLPLASQALAVLRAALDRTIHSAEAQDRIRALRADSTARYRLDELADEHTADEALRRSASAQTEVE